MEYLDNKNYSGKEIYDYFESITRDEDGYFAALYGDMIHREFRLVKATIEEVLTDLLDKDSDFFGYYNAVEEDGLRYDYDSYFGYTDENGEGVEGMERSELFQPIIILDGELRDGYSRLSTHMVEGIETILAYIAIEE